MAPPAFRVTTSALVVAAGSRCCRTRSKGIPDATHNSTLRFELTAGIVNIINKVSLPFSLKPFRATTQSTSGASSASSSSAQAHHHSLSVCTYGVDARSLPGRLRWEAPRGAAQPPTSVTLTSPAGLRRSADMRLLTSTSLGVIIGQVNTRAQLKTV